MSLLSHILPTFPARSLTPPTCVLIRPLGAALIDMSFMSKFRVQGADAGALLNWLSTANVDPVGETDVITYTQWCNEDGKLEADLTVTKLGENDFMVVATDTMHRHVEAWMQR